MADKLRSFRWLGTADGSEGRRTGNLHIQLPPPSHERRVIEPGDLVRKEDNLNALGSARIKELVEIGHAEYLDIIEKLSPDELLKRNSIKPDSSSRESELSKGAAADAALESAVAMARAQNMANSTLDSRVTGEVMGSDGRRQMISPLSPPVVPAAPDLDDDSLGGPPK